MYGKLKKINEMHYTLRAEVARMGDVDFWVSEAQKQGLITDFTEASIRIKLEVYGPEVKVLLHPKGNPISICGWATYTVFNNKWEIHNPK